MNRTKHFHIIRGTSRQSSHFRSTALSLIFTIALFLFIITFSIGLPIYFRPFYYAHIYSMHLPEKSGFTESEIREAYDNVLDYLTLPGKDFSTGVMAHSADGAAHFADCRVLFNLNAAVLFFSGATLLILLILRKCGKLQVFKLGKRGCGFWAAIFAVTVPLIIGGFAAFDFDRAFVVFHKIFFPVKDNWVFNYRTDEIIRVLPQDFFMHCAILIGVSILTISAILIFAEFYSVKKEKRGLHF